jgi:hypothetical protein
MVGDYSGKNVKEGERNGTEGGEGFVGRELEQRIVEE